MMGLLSCTARSRRMREAIFSSLVLFLLASSAQAQLAINDTKEYARHQLMNGRNFSSGDFEDGTSWYLADSVRRGEVFSDCVAFVDSLGVYKILYSTFDVDSNSFKHMFRDMLNGPLISTSINSDTQILVELARPSQQIRLSYIRKRHTVYERYKRVGSRP
jgi:hypothetical protein